MTKINKLIVLSVGLLFLGTIPSFAEKNRQPLDANNRPLALEWHGCTTQVVLATTSATSVTDEAAFVDWIMVSSGSAGSYAVLFDAEDDDGVTLSSTSYFAMSPVFTEIPASTTSREISKLQVPIVMSNGIVIINSTTDIVTTVCYRLKP